MTGTDGFNLSYQSLTSEEAKKALSERMKKSKEFTDTLSRLEPVGTEDDEVISDVGGMAVEYDEVDSSKTVEEEVVDLMAAEVDDSSDEGKVCVGTNLEQYIGYEFSSHTATDAWMQWSTKGSH